MSKEMRAGIAIPPWSTGLETVATGEHASTSTKHWNRPNGRFHKVLDEHIGRSRGSESLNTCEGSRLDLTKHRTVCLKRSGVRWTQIIAQRALSSVGESMARAHAAGPRILIVLLRGRKYVSWIGSSCSLKSQEFSNKFKLDSCIKTAGNTRFSTETVV